MKRPCRAVQRKQTNSRSPWTSERRRGHLACTRQILTARDFFAGKTSILGTSLLETQEDIYNIILKAMRLLKKDSDTVTKVAEHGVALLKKMDEQKLQEEMVEKVTKTVELSFAKFDISKQIQQQLLQANDEINQKLESMIAIIYGAGDKTTGKTASYNDGCSYAEVARSN
ncbi:hypothetical protein GGU10DRAFT_337634 [Lentinula aff. detonsa]|uniref:Uncharacterized protein n=1 Tax=Lentinula aff. detonsa TaxID=2804958 RepID=A0AA38NH81_9AGAR|nr:hypothetical protein GGU10DRAFT_337634 [Lentinula aff. detonsa]